VHPEHATIVVVGPRAEVAGQIEALGLREMELWDPEGFPIANRAQAPQAKKLR
jgi:hypothetical protein